MDIIVVTAFENLAGKNGSTIFVTPWVVALAVFVPFHPVFHAAGVIMVHANDFMRRLPVTNPQPMNADLAMIFHDGKRVSHGQARRQKLAKALRLNDGLERIMGTETVKSPFGKCLNRQPFWSQNMAVTAKFIPVGT